MLTSKFYSPFSGLVLFLVLSVFQSALAVVPAPDSLPRVFNDETDVLHGLYRHKALNSSKKHQLPGTLEEWNKRRAELKSEILRNAGVKFFKDLPLDLREMGMKKGSGFSVRNIYFQTRPKVYATANLFVPEGEGKFPAVVVMMGHSRDGKLYESYQLIGQSLAKDGYVALCIDPWGAGERTSLHGDFEYHGTALGASLMNVGETLLGMQITDNMRAVDLLTSLPYVDASKIGATGASGGGNQTMWLAALDERVKAAMPVVSVGTFDSYIMAHNCVCEVLPNGLTVTEEWGVLGLVAPRAIKMCNHREESNPTFFPSEMQKSFVKAQPVFDLNGVSGNIRYELFDRPHGYYPENREALLGWMDLYLKGTGAGKPRKEKPVEPFPADDLMVFEKGKRDVLVHSTESFTRMVGAQLKGEHEKAKEVSADTKRTELVKLLAASLSESYQQQELGSTGTWERVVLETSGGRLLPLLVKGGKSREFAILSHADGKNAIPLEVIRQLEQSGKGILIVDFSGTGEARSPRSGDFDKLGHLHTYGRASLWLGETVMGNWTTELGQVVNWLSKTKKSSSISYHGYKGAGLTGIFYNAMGGKLKEIHTYQSPVSYVFDSRQGAEFFGVGIHIPGIVRWGDVSLAAALSSTAVFLHQSVTMSGRDLSQSEKDQFRKEYDSAKSKAKGAGTVTLD